MSLRNSINSIRIKNRDIVAQATKPALSALSSVRAIVRARIQAGEATEGRQIGQYSTNPTLIGRKSFLTKKGANKYLGSKQKRKGLSWVTTKGGKRVAVLPGGYKAIREADGRQTKYVDLSYAGTMLNSYALAPSADGFVLGFTNRFQAVKMFANEKRFKKKVIWLSDKEIEEARRIYANELARRLNS